MNMSLNIHDHVLLPEGIARNILLDYPMTGAGGGKTGYRSGATYHLEDINFVISWTTGVLMWVISSCEETNGMT